MENSIVLTFVLCFVALSTGSVLQTRQDAGLPELEPPALEAFLVPFREAVLHRVAVAWNHTITDSAKLEVDMQTCSNQIKTTVEQCKTCAANACTKTPHVVSSSPTFTDYLLLATQLFNPEFLKGPLNEIGDKFGDIVDLLGSGSASFIDSMSSLGNDIGGAFTDVFHGLEKSFNAVKDALQKAIDGLTDVGNSIGNGLTDAGNTVIDGIGGIFGRKRRETVSPELKACMTPCSTCQPLLKTNHTEMIVSVCGEQVVKFNETVRHNVISIKGIFTAVSDKTHPVITKIQIDPTSLSGVSYTRIYITGNIKGKYVRYESKVIYDMMNLGSTANNIAEEFWKLWM